jgi:hypothetical protein
LNYPNDDREILIHLHPTINPDSIPKIEIPHKTNIFSTEALPAIDLTAPSAPVITEPNPNYIYLYNENGDLTGIHDPEQAEEETNSDSDSSVLSIEEFLKRKQHEKEKPFWQGTLRCLNCQSTWTATGTRGPDNFECPACKSHCGVHNYPFSPSSEVLSYRCNHCEGFTFFLTRETLTSPLVAMCLRCGFNHDDP